MGAGLHTISLAFIAKTQEQADAMLAKWGPHFDEAVYEVGVIKDSFSDVRNRVLANTKTDYWMWFDTDDEVTGLQNLHNVVETMAQRGIDALYLPYEYAYNEQGECIVLQWRERILKTSHPFQWMGAIHESAISTTAPLLDRSDEIVIKHIKSHEEHGESAERNHQILLKEYKKKERDPRITHYLAMSFFNKGEHAKAVKLFKEHIQTSGWDEDQYRSWFYTGQAYGLMNRNKDVLNAANEGIKLIPSRPECYVLAATAEFELGNMEKCLEWLKNSSTKEPPKNSLSAIDPTYYSYKAEFLAAQAYLRMGKVKEAYEQMKLVLQHSPNFPAARELAPLFQELYDDQAAVSKLQWLAQYFEVYQGKAEKLFEGLPPKLLADPRLNDIRSRIYKPVKWPEKSLVFFCGEAAELWGPDTLDRGIGGSEEAVIYLSRELARLGWQVVVYNAREEPYEDNGTDRPPVIYRPWTLFNPRDEFNILVSWRRPGLFTTLGVKAKVRAVDMHDMPLGHVEIEQQHERNIDKIFFKSKFQADLVAIPDTKKAVISNGVVRQQFNKKVKRREHSVGYYSSYDRGLGCLLHLWPRIKEQVPDATLDIYYGWNSFDSMHQGNPQQQKWKLQMLRDLHLAKKLGVTERGRVNHEQLAEAMLSTEAWAYPTEFPEINCITALKSGLAGSIPVTSGYAALQETVQEPQPDYDETIYTDKAVQDDFVKRLVKALKEGRTESERAEYSKKYEKYDWSEIAKQWDKELEGR